VGVTAGASTPDWIIKEVVDTMTEFEDNNRPAETDDQRAELAPGPAEEVPVGAAPNEMDEAFAQISPGARLKGRVTKVEADQAYVDIGGKTDGVIQLRDLSHRNLTSASEAVSLGEEIEVIVLRTENDKGEPVLSKRRADAEDAWERVTKAQQEGTVLPAKVVERVKGGLVVDLGLRGFIPGSQVSREYVTDLDALVGKELFCKVIELDEAKHSAVLSHRVVEEEEAKSRRETAFSQIKPGEVVKGTVKRLTTFGAFVDIGGVEGLLHISEMAWGRVQTPSDVLHEGEEIQVKIIRVEPDSGKIALSLRQAAPDPWQLAKSRYHEGDVVEGEVVRVVDFGAFVRLEDGIEGLVHISQLAEERVGKASDVVKPGDRIQVKVLSFDPEQKRVSLSRKQVLPPTQRHEPAAPLRAHKEEVPALPEAPPVTLGDMFGALFEDRLKDKGDE
jgi:4-hydroxy-3-methylbut-2-enyl diphosphate reductase